MIADTQILSDLIGTIYDTTLDRALWPDVLRRSAEFVGGAASWLYSKNVVRQAGKRALYWNPSFDVISVPGYFAEYLAIDPTRIGRVLFDVGQVYSIEDCMPYAEFLETRLYKEYARPMGLVDQLAATLDKSATDLSLFAVFRSEEQGLVDAEMRRRMRLIVPHVRRAVLIANVMDLNATEATAFAATLDGLAAGVFLVDEGARIIFANRSGRIMLDEGKIVCQKNRALMALDQRTGAMLPDAVALAGGGDAAVGANAIAVQLSPPPEPWLAHILPLTSGARRCAGMEYSAVAAVFVHQASLEAPSAIETMAKLYRLTSSELRVLAAMIEVGGVAAVAEVVGLGESTVKTHLQHLFAKTGTNRQTDLVKLAATHASPLRQVP
jgi:DNA-binding CsgD family transcriptional regulator/PAS domain-containing protein